MNKQYTVITVCYNCVKDIEKTILSVIQQNEKTNIEYIIVDGNSTDGTKDIIKKYADSNKEIVKYISEPDNGIYDAMNKGIRLSSGEWVIFMNAGDRFTDDTILSAIKSYCDEDTDVIYGDKINALGNVYKYCKSNSIYDIKEKKDWEWCHQSVLVRRSVITNRIFDDGYIVAADLDMMISLYTSGRKFKYINIPISIYQKDGLSGDKGRLIGRIEMLDVYKKYGIINDKEYRMLIMQMSNNCLFYVNKSTLIKSVFKKILPNSLVDAAKQINSVLFYGYTRNIKSLVK